MQMRLGCRSVRGAARAGLLSFLLLAALALVVGLGGPRASAGASAGYVRLPAAAVRARTISLREVVRRAASGPRPGSVEVPSSRLQPAGAEAGGAPEALFTPPTANVPGPALLRSFNTLQDTGSEPPSGSLAVGPSHLVSAGNASFRVFNKQTGVPITPEITLLSFFTGKDTTNNVFAPRVDYDINTDRFYLVSVGRDTANSRSQLEVAVSQTGDPTGAWHQYVFDVAEANPATWMNYPALGYNSEALFVTGNQTTFTGSTFDHARLVILDKVKLLAGQPVTPTLIRPTATPAPFSIQPAASHDVTTTEWMTETAASATASSFLRVWKVTNALGANPILESIVLTAPDYAAPPTMPQNGTADVLDGGDGRVGNTVLRRGQLWTTHGVSETVSGAARAAVRVYRLAPSGSGALVSTYSLSDAARGFYYPSLEMDAYGSVMVGFSSASSTTFPGIQYAVKGVLDAQFSDPTALRAGTVAYNRTGTSPSRWGEHSDCAFDPENPNVIWHQNELAATANTWVLHAGAVPATPSGIRVLSPVGSESLQVGSTVKIQWQSVALTPPGSVRIDVSRDGGQTYTETIIGSTVNDGEFDWVVTGPASTQARVRVTSLSTPAINDASDANFNIVNGSVTVTSPNGGEVLRLGSTVALQWSLAEFAALQTSAKIELSRNGGADWEVLFDAVPNDGQQEWTVTGPVASEALLRVSTVPNSQGLTFQDQSNAFFEIREPSSLTVLSPNGGEKVAVGSVLPITWASTGFTGNVRIELSRDAGLNYATLFANAPNSGEASYTVTGPLTRFARLRITSLSEPNISDTNNGQFEILARSITITSPTAGQRLLTGRLDTITYTSTGLLSSDNVRVELSRNGGRDFEVLFNSTRNDGAEPFLIEGPATTAAVVRISSVAYPEVFDVSDTFGIASPTLFLISPRGGEKLRVGEQSLIEWSGTTVGQGTVNIELSRNGGRTWETVAAGVANDGAQQLAVRGRTTKKARLRITWNEDGETRDASPRNFQIVPPRRGRGR